jgi:hypothetical protein
MGEMVSGEVVSGAGGEEGLVPAAGGVVDVDCRGGGFDGGEAVVVVDGVEQLDVQDRAHAGDHLAGEAYGSAAARL